MTHEKDCEPKFVAVLSTETPHEDGGTATDVLGVLSNLEPEVVIQFVEENYGVSLEAVAEGTRDVREARRKSSMGYTGSWNSPWDPHGKDGKIIYQ